MKKNLYILLASCILLTSGAFCSEFKTVSKKLSNCTKSVIEKNAKIYHIVGYYNGKCHYREYSPDTYLNCAFDSKTLKEYIGFLKQKEEALKDNTNVALKSLNKLEQTFVVSKACTFKNNKE